MTAKKAIVLIAHGSPDPDWRAPLEAVARQLTGLALGHTVALAYLDFSPPTLEVCCAQLHQSGHTDIRVIAAFLSAGGKHLKKDVPNAVRSVAAAYPDIRIELDPGALGEDAGVVAALADAALRRARLA